MQARIQKWGNSLALRIPKSFALETMIQQDTLVDHTLQDGKLIISPVSACDTLDEMLAQITPENLHFEQDFGQSAGQEIW